MLLEIAIKKKMVTSADGWLGDPGARNIKNMPFCKSEQIRLARRFVSSFIYETDATFNTNKLKMPLLVLFRILNIAKSLDSGYHIRDSS